MRWKHNGRAILCGFTGILKLPICSFLKESLPQSLILVIALSVILPLACVVVFVIVQSPVILVLIAGVTQLLMLPVIGFSAIYFRYFETDKRLRPGLAWDAFLILSSLAMLFVGAWGIYNKTKSAKIMQVFTARRTDQPDPVGIYPSRDEALAKAADDPDHEYVISECNFPVPPPTSRHGAVGWIDLTELIA